MNMKAVISSLIAVLSLVCGVVTAASSKLGDLTRPDDQHIQLEEADRIEEYKKRNYTWPLDNYNPNTEGWKRLMGERFGQIEEMENSGDRYEGYIQTMHSAFLVPNFTEHGFGLARCPEELLGALQQGIRDGLPTAGLERDVQIIDGPQALFVNRPDLTDRVLNELKHYAETWAKGVELTPYRAYGFRLYQNNSRLHTHIDKCQTHIISFILHIDSSEDAEPWPIFIEDFHGNTHEVILKPGDMLFYESSKMWHGRPKRLNGSWYSSLFVHYYPTHDWYHKNHALESHYAVPQHWSREPPTRENRQYRELKMVGTGMTEPECPNEWCRTMSSKKWSGPGKEGFWIAPDGTEYPFHPQHESWKEEL
mmetsp:Transcript_20696/g.26717  ORF Transcript_20696/g.26717 Transcript_20696/m.26717 type:complete len:365 (-) Transcript_20696:91-1185(-)